MIKFAFTVSFAVLTFVASTSFADAEAETLPSNHAPVCEAKTVVIGPMPEDLDLGAFSINPIKSKQACTDQDGDTVTLATVSMPASIDPDGIHFEAPPEVGHEMTVTYTVTDGNGGTANATLTILRK